MGFAKNSENNHLLLIKCKALSEAVLMVEPTDKHLHVATYTYKLSFNVLSIEFINTYTDIYIKLPICLFFIYMFIYRGIEIQVFAWFRQVLKLPSCFRLLTAWIISLCQFAYLGRMVLAVAFFRFFSCRFLSCLSLKIWGKQEAKWSWSWK